MPCSVMLGVLFLQVILPARLRLNFFSIAQPHFTRTWKMLEMHTTGHFQRPRIRNSPVTETGNLKKKKSLLDKLNDIGVKSHSGKTCPFRWTDSEPRVCVFQCLKMWEISMVALQMTHL